MLPKYQLIVILTMYLDTNVTPNFDLELSPFGENAPERFSSIRFATMLR